MVDELREHSMKNSVSMDRRSSLNTIMNNLDGRNVIREEEWNLTQRMTDGNTDLSVAEARRLAQGNESIKLSNIKTTSKALEMFRRSAKRAKQKSAE